MKIAVVGSGISGLIVAHLLHRDHDLTLFEAQDHVGGHTLTTEVERDGRRYNVDAGFIVYNEITYPNFVRLLDRLKVETQPSDMSFSVRCEASGLEYCGTSLNTLFAQRRNLLSPGFYRMLWDILRFNRQSRELIEAGEVSPRTLGELLEEGRFSRRFVQHYLIPMGAAIWSTDPRKMMGFPAGSFLTFLANHGLLSVNGQYPWRVVRGGSKRYVEAMTEPFHDRIRLSTPVRSVRREPDGVKVATDASPEGERFDQVVLATHSDQALALLEQPSDREREILSAFPYQRNEAVLHTDSSLLPRNRRAWASWNYFLPPKHDERIALTYNMNRLQGLETSGAPFCVSLNLTERIEPEKILRRFSFSHPLFSTDSAAAQKRHAEISGVDRIHYCGAYWRHGFHEDGLVSGQRVARYLGRKL